MRAPCRIDVLKTLSNDARASTCRSIISTFSTGCWTMPRWFICVIDANGTKNDRFDEFSLIEFNTCLRRGRNIYARWIKMKNWSYYYYKLRNWERFFGLFEILIFWILLSWMSSEIKKKYLVDSLDTLFEINSWTNHRDNVDHKSVTAFVFESSLEK